jgi:hypothetical protein
MRHHQPPKTYQQPLLLLAYFGFRGMADMAGLAACSTRWQMPPERPNSHSQRRELASNYPAGQFEPITVQTPVEADFLFRLEEQSNE